MYGICIRVKRLEGKRLELHPLGIYLEFNSRLSNFDSKQIQKEKGKIAFMD